MASRVGVAKVELHYEDGRVVAVYPKEVAALFFNQKWADAIRTVAGGQICTQGWDQLIENRPGVVSDREPGPGGPPVCVKLNDCTWWCPDDSDA